MATQEFRFEELRGPLVDKFVKSNDNIYKYGLIKVWPSGCTFYPEYRNHAQRIRDLEVRADDVWIVTYPKCGTTWTQEMVWLLMNNLDYEKAGKILLTERSPFIEYGCMSGSDDLFQVGDTVAQVEELESPRVVKTHLPLELLPKQLWTVKPKQIIYVARGAKDVAVSYFHHHRLWNCYVGTSEDFVDAFIEGYPGYGSLWDHILEFWKIRNEPYVLFNTFEEMKKDLPNVVQRTAKFLNKSLNCQQLQKLCEHLSFDSMKNNTSVNHDDELGKIARPTVNVEERFMRKGQVGNWKSELTPQQAEKIDKWTDEKIKGTGYVLH
ncbi:luciferin sulfotransferase-like [Periplaneta americana]|uniref:luciferin sulfotransferase-like n=1 Tax=Periplaneta americana TaxID=6978 RepID=UPI0037E93383